jgi:hypothetical protein
LTRRIAAFVLFASLVVADSVSGQSLGVSRRATSGSATSGPSSSEVVRILVLSDTHTAWGFGGSTPPNTFMLREVVDTAAVIGVDFAVNSGD